MASMLHRALLTAGVLAAAAGVGAAQGARGAVNGQVTDTTGSALPGVTVTIESPALVRPLVAVTNETGEFTFADVPAGTYRVIITLSGFQPVSREGVVVAAGGRADVKATLDPAGVRQAVVVSSFDRALLERVPSARDPWVVINMTPGVVTDGVNVGGSTSGQQMTYAARGEGSANSSWNLEGATITDMAATGASPTYFNFDAFEEVRVTTGATDASVQTSGVQISLVTKRGTNAFTGSARFLTGGRALESNNVSPELFDAGVGPGTPLRKLFDYGAEAGGPILRDKLWFWGGFGVQDITTSTPGFFQATLECTPPPTNSYEFLDQAKDCLFPDRARLLNGNAKLNYDASSSRRFQGMLTLGNKIRNSRGALNTTRPDATWHQHGTVPLVSLKHTWTPGTRVVVDSLFQDTGGGFQLDFQRDALATVQPSLDFLTGIQDRSTTAQFIDRPALEVRADANWLAPRFAGGDHTLRFGFGWRRNDADTLTRTGGNAIARFVGGVSDSAALTRDGRVRVRLHTTSLYAQDEYSLGRLRASAGVRFDYQDDRALSTQVDANPIVPDFLPAVTFDGIDPGVDFLDIAPRLAAAYDLSGRGRTVLHGSFAWYFDQNVNLAAGYSSATTAETSTTAWDDLDGDLFVQRAELDLLNLPFCALPEGCDSLPLVDGDLQNRRTREAVIGIHHQLIPHVTIGASYLRRWYDRYRWAPRIGETSDIYVARSWFDPPSGRTGTYYEIAPGLTRPPNLTRTVNNPTRSLDYQGLEITAHKEFNDGWMANASLTFNGTRERRPSGSYIDPTNIEFIDGYSGGAFSTRYVAKLNGFAVLPWDFSVSATVNIQDGFLRNLVFDGPPSRNGGLGAVTLLADPVGTSRYPNLTMMDVQVDRAFTLPGGRARLNLALVVFNLFNVSTTRSQVNNLSRTNFDRIETIVSPRVMRIGARLVF